MPNYIEDPHGSGFYREEEANSPSPTYFPASTGTKIRVRRGTGAEWNEKNPILAFGEPGFDVTNNVFKMGNGVQNWRDLPVLNFLGGGFTRLTQAEWDAMTPEERDENLMYVIVNG